MIRLSIIVLNYNTKDLTKQCLQTLLAIYNKEFEKGEFELIMVDNDSLDGSFEEISKYLLSFPKNFHLHVLKNPKNFGFSKGCNQGAKNAKGEYILFVNSDTIVLGDGISSMIQFLETNPKIGILGGKLVDPNGKTTQSASSFYTIPKLVEVLFLPKKNVSNETAARKIDWVEGSFLMVRKSLFDILKGFDEGFFMYMEDMDLCFRARKEKFDTYYYPNAVFEHTGQGSSNRSFAIIQIYKGLLYFYRKHKSKFELFILKTFLFLKASIALVIGIVSGNSYLKKTYSEALSILI